MQAPRRITAFTLVEILIVLVIFGMMMVLSGGMSRRTRDTFISQQYIKSAVQNSRILRRKSMLITRNSGETAWVQGIGFRFEKDDTSKQWTMTQVKALGATVSGNYFYQSFPTITPCLELDWTSQDCAGSNKLLLKRLENSTQQMLPVGMNFTISTGSTPATCLKALTVIYESINGKIHAYCQGTTGGDATLGNPLDIKVKITYSTGGVYQYHLNLKDNGEINASKN